MELNKPKPFTFTKNNVRQDWRNWKEEFSVYLKLSGGYAKFTEEERALLLINLMGTEAIKAMNDMSFDDPNERNDMDILLMKFDHIFDPPLNEVEERNKFFSRRKTKNESIHNYVTDLKDKAATCNFGDQMDKIIQDMLILNMDSNLRKAIFVLNQEITLEGMIQQYETYERQNEKIKEVAKNMSKSFKPNDSENISKQQFASFNQGQSKQRMSQSSKQNIEKKQQNRICSKCGTNHEYKNCPAYNFTCQKCFTKGHYTDKCKSIESSGNTNNANVNRGKYGPRDEQTKQPHNNFNAQQKMNKPTVNQIENCLWCETKHIKGQCPHNQNCTNCNSYPHKICFQCKKNPHDNNCYYKSVITLPSTTPQVNRNLNAPKCLLCGVAHAQSAACSSIYQTRPTVNAAPPTYDKDSFLHDYVNVESKPKPEYSRQNSSKNTTTRANTTKNTPGFSHNNSRKHNEKSDPCTIS